MLIKIYLTLLWICNFCVTILISDYYVLLMRDVFFAITSGNKCRYDETYFYNLTTRTSLTNINFTIVCIRGGGVVKKKISEPFVYAQKIGTNRDFLSYYNDVSVLPVIIIFVELDCLY